MTKSITPVSPYSKSVRSWQLPSLQGSYEETGLMDFGHYERRQLRTNSTN